MSSSPEDREKVYQFSKLLFIIAIPLFLLCLIIGFVLSYPLKSEIEGHVSKMANNKNCPFTYDDFELDLLPLGASFKKLTLSGRCFQKPGLNLQFDQAFAHLTLPGLFPPALKSKIRLQRQKTYVEITPRINWKQSLSGMAHIEISEWLALFLPYVKLDGHLQLKIHHLTLKKQNIDSGLMTLRGEKLYLPEQNINGFLAPSLPIKTIKGDIQLQRQKLLLKKITLGGTGSPVKAQVQGDIKLNMQYPPRSIMNLKIKLNLAPELLEQLSILELFLGEYEKSKGVYHIALKGTFLRPTPSKL